MKQLRMHIYSQLHACTKINKKESLHIFDYKYTLILANYKNKTANYKKYSYSYHNYKNSKQIIVNMVKYKVSFVSEQFQLVE